jgi:hypothetical protein
MSQGRTLAKKRLHKKVLFGADADDGVQKDPIKVQTNTSNVGEEV